MSLVAVQSKVRLPCPFYAEARETFAIKAHFVRLIFRVIVDMPDVIGFQDRTYDLELLSGTAGGIIQNENNPIFDLDRKLIIFEYWNFVPPGQYDDKVWRLYWGRGSPCYGFSDVIARATPYSNFTINNNFISKNPSNINLPEFDLFYNYAYDDVDYKLFNYTESRNVGMLEWSSLRIIPELEQIQYFIIQQAVNGQWVDIINVPKDTYTYANPPEGWLRVKAVNYHKTYQQIERFSNLVITNRIESEVDPSHIDASDAFYMMETNKAFIYYYKRLSPNGNIYSSDLEIDANDLWKERFVTLPAYRRLTAENLYVSSDMFINGQFTASASVISNFSIIDEHGVIIGGG